MNRAIVSLVLASCLSTLGSLAQAESVPELPSTMINSPPLTKQGLAGKVVVLFFYEEDCPTCRKAWPSRLKVAAKYSGQPVIFMAVNSGNSAEEVSGYLQSVNCNWPTIVDADRSFEKNAIGSEVSLKNIIQVRVITPAGELVGANFDDPSAQIDDALKTAKWKIDPQEIPAALKTAWQLFEVGNFNQAAAALASAQKSVKDEAGKEAAEKLKTAITTEYQKLLEPAAKAEEEGELWLAYKGYASLAQLFSSLPEAKELKAKLTKLSKDKAVLKEQKGAKMWQEAIRSVNAASPATQKRGKQMVQQLSKDYAETEAGKAAQAALDKLESGSN